jgi:hypothetical protein
MARADDIIGGSLQMGLRIIEDELLANGEIPNYRQLPDGSWEYCFSPLASAYVHDGLSCFDPLSRWFDPFLLEFAAERRQFSFARRVSAIRRNIRRFLAWQEESHGTWRLFGRGSGLAADLDTTACAAAALWDNCRLQEPRLSSRRDSALDRFRSGEDFGSPGSRGAGCETGISSHWVGRANAVRYLALVGGPAEMFMAPLEEAMENGAVGEGSRIPFYFACARAWRQGGLPGRERIANHMVPQLRKLCRSQGPLSAPLGAIALLDLDCAPADIFESWQFLLKWWASPQRLKMEPFCDDRCGSPAWTASMSMVALARLAYVMHGAGE